MRLKINDNRPERARTPKREVIYANVGHLPNGLCRQGHNTSKEGGSAGLDAQTLSHANAKPAAGCQAECLYDLKEAERHACPRLKERRQALHEDFLRTGDTSPYDA